MKRRAVLALLGASAAAWPFAVLAEPRMPRIGFLSPAYFDRDVGFEAFRAGLGDLGYVEGQNVELAARFWVDPEEEMGLARDLINLKVDVIVTSADGVIAAHNVTEVVPIVAAVTFDLVALGLADSLGHPGRNVTGLTFFVNELQVKRVALLKQVKPAMKRVGLLVPEGSAAIASYLRAVDPPLRALGVAFEPIEVAKPSDCNGALSAGSGASIEGLVITDAPQFVVGAGLLAIAGAAAHHDLPSAGAPSLARVGGLLGYGVDPGPMFRRAAVFVDKILKGAKPADIPIEQATKFITVVNLKTAQTLGLDIPADVLAAADEVIE